MNTNCLNCNKVIKVKPSRLVNGKRVTCSLLCQAQHRQKKHLNDSCIICQKLIHLKPFHKKRYKGPFTCSRKCQGELLKDTYKGNQNPNHKYNDAVLKFLSIRCKDIRTRSKSKHIDFNLTPDYLHSLYLEQNGLCSYSGIPMKLGQGNFKLKGQADIDALSVDKIVPEKGYTIGNIVLCCNGVNRLKGNTDQKELMIFLQMLGLKTFGTCHIKVKKVRDNAVVPTRAKLGDGGYDMSAAFVEDLGNQIKVYTGIACQPDPGWVLLAIPRSSICKKNLRLSNSIGLIDNQYTGEIIAIFDKEDPSAKIDVNERIIQIIPQRTPFVTLTEIDELDQTDRGTGGFGSSNK